MGGVGMRWELEVEKEVWGGGRIARGGKGERGRS